MRWQKQWCDGEDEDEEEEQNCDQKHCTLHKVTLSLQFLCRHSLSQLVHSMSKSESNYENAIERPLLPLWLLIENLWPVRSSDVQTDSLKRLWSKYYWKTELEMCPRQWQWHGKVNQSIYQNLIEKNELEMCGKCNQRSIKNKKPIKIKSIKNIIEKRS